ncbi:hypothetical protein NFI96_025990, partial [Prochilodus magdalenae]
LYTNDCVSKEPAVKILKFSDDTTVLGLTANSAAPSPISPSNINCYAVSTVKFLGTTISKDLKWERNMVSIAKKAQQRMFFLRQLKKFNLLQNLMIQFYGANIEVHPHIFHNHLVWFFSLTRMIQNSCT